jgi:hypothetical protein
MALSRLEKRARADGPDLVQADWEGTGMSRIGLVCCSAALLGSCTQNYQQADWARARLACADIGLEPESSAFDGCVFDLYYTLWNEQYAGER